MVLFKIGRFIIFRNIHRYLYVGEGLEVNLTRYSTAVGRINIHYGERM